MMDDDDKISFPSISAQKSSYWGELGLILILELAFIVVLGILYIIDSFFSQNFRTRHVEGILVRIELSLLKQK